jgi:hypothetical protein
VGVEVPEWGLGGSFGAGTSTRPGFNDLRRGRGGRKAIGILKIALARPLDEYDDLGRVTDPLLHTLRQQPGQFTRT